MKDALTPTTLVLFALFVLPGLISMAVYRLRMPARLADPGSAIVQGLFYGALNYVLLLPLILFIHRDGYAELHPWRYWAGVLAMVFVAPAVWPVLLVWAYHTPWLARWINVPYPSVWDYVFRGREAQFVLLRLANGELIGGLWGPDSYAGQHPHEGDIFISSVYRVSESGDFEEPVPRSAGVHVRGGAYTSVEFFHLPVPHDPPHNFDA
jgi:hypothetical protein